MDVKLLWSFHYYDGPLSGMGMCNGEKVWLEVDEYGKYIEGVIFTVNEILDGSIDIPEIKEYIEGGKFYTDKILKTENYGIVISDTNDGEIEYRAYRFPEEVKEYIKNISLEVRDIDVEIQPKYHLSTYLEDKEICVFSFRTFGIYKIPNDIIKILEDNHRDWQEMVGYHSDHDPSIYKPFTGSSRFDEFTEKWKHFKFECKGYECIGKISSMNIGWYRTPW